MQKQLEERPGLVTKDKARCEHIVFGGGTTADQQCSQWILLKRGTCEYIDVSCNPQAVAFQYST